MSKVCKESGHCHCEMILDPDEPYKVIKHWRCCRCTHTIPPEAKPGRRLSWVDIDRAAKYC
jgi:hypothetical protein